MTSASDWPRTSPMPYSVMYTSRGKPGSDHGSANVASVSTALSSESPVSATELLFGAAGRGKCQFEHPYRPFAQRAQTTALAD